VESHGHKPRRSDKKAACIRSEVARKRSTAMITELRVVTAKEMSLRKVHILHRIILTNYN